MVLPLRSTTSRSGAVGSSSGSITAKLKRLMDTKLKGDIAEQSVALYALKQGWGVLKPLGDRLPYDLVFDVGKSLFKIQVKSAWRYRCFLHHAKRSVQQLRQRNTSGRSRQATEKTKFIGLSKCLGFNFVWGCFERNFEMKICQIRGSL